MWRYQIKKIIVLLFLILWGVSYSQEEVSINAEFIVHVKNWQNNSVLKLKAELVSECWDEFHELTDDYQGGFSNRQIIIYPPGVTPHASDLGLDMCWSDDTNTPLLGLGKYRIEVYEDQISMDTIFIDYRTSDLPASAQTGIDIEFDYDDVANKIYYQRTTIDAENETIWNMRQNIINVKTGLEPFAPDNFQISNRYQWNSNPQLTWDHSSEADYWTGYNVYRKEAAGTYQKIAELTKFTTSFTDQETVISEAGQNVSYYVKAVNGSKLSEPTQTIRVVGDVYKKGLNDAIISFELGQNFPNPFNPTTIINYSIPTDEFVSLKVFDLSGKEVAHLVNERKSAGNHQVIFNAERLSSGIYIYLISAGNFSSSRKLLLVK